MPLSRNAPELGRIALVFYRDSASSGGSLRIGEMLAAGLAAAGCDVHVLFAYGGPGPVSRNRALQSHFLGSHGPLDWTHWKSARKLLAELRPAVLHFIDPVVWLQAAAHGLQIPKVLHMHRTLLPEFVDISHRLAWHAVAPSAGAVVFISSASRQAYVRGHYGPRRRTHIVRNAIDFDAYCEAFNRVDARQELGLGEASKVLLMVGSLRREKGCFDALALLELMPSEWVLLFCGDGPDRRELQDLANRVPNRVVFAGSVDDVRPAYAAADALLCLSYYESFGLFMCQAMAAGVPVFGLWGKGEYAEQDYPLVTSMNAMLLPRKTPEFAAAGTDKRDLRALAARLCDFAAHPNRYRSMTESARVWVRERFDVDRYVREMLAVYGAVTHSPQPQFSVRAVAGTR